MIKQRITTLSKPQIMSQFISFISTGHLYLATTTVNEQHGAFLQARSNQPQNPKHIHKKEEELDFTA